MSTVATAKEMREAVKLTERQRGDLKRREALMRRLNTGPEWLKDMLAALADRREVENAILRKGGERAQRYVHARERERILAARAFPVGSVVGNAYSPLGNRQRVGRVLEDGKLWLEPVDPASTPLRGMQADPEECWVLREEEDGLVTFCGDVGVEEAARRGGVS